jgi:hypothetical protein
MATADEYADWIVKNADKKGTPDFDTVAAAYREARAEEQAAAKPAAPAPRAEAPKPVAPAPKKAAPVEGSYGFMGEGIDDTTDVAVTKPDLGVMSGYVPPSPVKTASKAPFRPEVRRAIEGKYDAANPKEREKLESAPGAVGDVIRQRAQEYERAKNLPEATRVFDPRAEARAERLVAAGEKPEFARVAAEQAAEAGALPGKEIDFMSYLGLATPRPVNEPLQADYEKKNIFERGTAKAKAGVFKTVYGINQALGELAGADEYARAQGISIKEQQAIENAIGENPDYFKRQSENVVNSISQYAIPTAVGAVVGGPALAFGAMWVQTFGQEYADSRQAKLDPTDATQRAAWMATAEVLGEIPSFGRQLKLLRGVFKTKPTEWLKDWVVTTAAREIPGEQLTTLLQYVGDIKGVSPFGLNDKASLKGYLQAATDTLVQTVMQSAVMGGGAKSIRSTADYLKGANETRDPFEKDYEDVAKAKGFLQGTTGQAQPAPPASPLQQPLTQAYAQQGVPANQAAEVAQQSVAALTTPPAQSNAVAAAQTALELPVTEGQNRVMQRSDAEDEARTTAGRAERAELQAKGTTNDLTEPPPFVTEPSTDQSGAGVYSPSEEDATGRTPSAIERGLGRANDAIATVTGRKKQQRASLEDQGFVRDEEGGGKYTPFHQNIANKLSQAFRLQAFPNLSPIFGPEWMQRTMASNPTPDEFQEAAYTKLEELDARNERPTYKAAPAAAKPALAPKVEKTQPTALDYGSLPNQQLIDIYEDYTGTDEQYKAAKTELDRRGEFAPVRIAQLERILNNPNLSVEQRTPFESELSQLKAKTKETTSVTKAPEANKKALGEYVKSGRPVAIATYGDGVITVGPSLDASTHVELKLTPEERRTFNLANSDLKLADTIEERKAAKDAEQAALKSAIDRALKQQETPSVTETPKAEQAKKEGQAQPAAKPAAPAGELPLLAGRNEAIEIEEEDKVIARVTPEKLKAQRIAEFGATATGEPRKRGKGGGRDKTETAKTKEERDKQIGETNQLNRDAITLVKAAKKYTERTGQYPTEAEYDFAEALRIQRLDQIRMALHGLALRARSRPLTGYIAAAQYMRSLKPAERERAQALWEGKAKLTELPVKPKATLTPAQLERFRAGEKLSKRGRPKKEKTEAVAKTKKEKEAKALAEARENVLGGKKIEFFMSPDAPATLKTPEEFQEAFEEFNYPPREDTGSSLSLVQLYGSLKDAGVITKEEFEALTGQQELTEKQEEELFFQKIDEREAGKEVPPSKAQEEVEDRTIHDELDDDEKKVIAKHYGESTYNEVAQKKFTADVILALNEGLDAVSRVLHDIIKRLQASVLAGIMVMNTSFMTPPMRVAVPTTETRTVQVLAEVPTEAKGMSKAGELAFKNIFPAIQADLKRDNKLFVLTDKPSATVFVFNPDGSLLVQSKVLLGKTLGDYYVGKTDIDINKITPAGLFTLGLRDAARGITERGGDEKKTAGHYDFGKVFVLDKAIDGEASVTLFHSVWTHEKDAPKRLAALKKAGPEDSRYSFGCINLDKNVYGDLIANHQDQMDGAKMFVVPDEQAATMDFIRGKAITKGDLVRQSTPEITKTVTEQVPPATSRAEERKTPATLRKEQVAFGRRRRAETEEGGATDLGMEPLAARRNTATDAFKAWFRNSVVRDRDGEPKVMYHGTARDITEFRAKQAGAIFVTDDPKFAEAFGFNSEFYMMKELFNTATPEQRNKWIMDAAKQALAGENIDKEIFNEIKQSVSQMDASFGFIPSEVETEVYATLKNLLPSRNNVVPVYVSAQNPFDYENPAHIEKIREEFSKLYREPLPAKNIQSGNWSVIEGASIQKTIKAAGFDGFYVLEGGYKNLAVYEPTQIKSVFNKGTYDPTDNRILASQARDREIAEQQLDMEPDPFFNQLESIGGALAYIAASPNKLESELALRLLAPDNRAALKDVQFVVVEKNDKTIPRDIKKMLNTQVDGYYVPDTKGGTVYVRGLSYGERTQGINKEIVLHEAFHAAGAKKIEYAMLAKRLGFPVDKNLSEAVQELEDLMGRAKAAFDAQGDKANTHLKFLNNADAFTNIQEFYAYGMTDSVMKSFLLNDVSGVIEKESGFDALINAVLKLFGINPKLKSGLKDLVLISHEIMQAQQPSGTELANRLKEANKEIRLAAKRQAKATATAERDLKASQSPSAIIGSVSAMQSSARDFGVIGTFMENNFSSMQDGVLRGLLNVAPTSTLFKIGAANGIARLEETRQLIRGRGAMRMGIQKEMEAIVSRWRKLSQKQLELLADTMHLSTDLQEDPSLPVQYSGRIGVRSQELRNLWQQLAQVPDGHKLYKDVRDFYKKAVATFIANLKQQIATSALTGNINDLSTPKGKAFQEILDTYEAGIGTGPYFPLMRHGKHWARFGKRGDVNFQLRDNENDIKRFINAQLKERKRLGDKRNMEELRAAGEADFGKNVKILHAKIIEESTSLRKIFRAVDNAAGSTTVFDELKKDIFQMHLLLLPEQSFRKMFIPRKNRAGYDRDALKNFVFASRRLSNQLAGSRYNRRISDSLTAATESLEGMAGKEKFELLVDEIKKRTELILNPPEQEWGENFVRGANKFSFMYLLTDFRQAANNLWSLPSKGLPTLVKYFGEVATLKELTSVLFGRGLINQVGITKTDANGKVTWHAPSMSLSPMVKNSRELTRVAEIMEAREINGGVSMTSDVYLASKGQSITTAGRIGEAIIRTSGALHQGSERAAREMLFWSAYLLSRKQKLPMLKAIDKAQNIVEEALFRYAPDEMPPWANKPFPRLIFQFQKFAALNTNFYVVNTLEATGAMPSDVQAGAAKALLGAYMMAILATGLGGAFGVSMMIYLFGVVDGAWERYANKNLKQSLMNMSPLRWFKEQYLVEKFGAIKLPGTDKTLADGLADGFLDTYSGLKLSSGVSEGSLWFGEPPTALDVQVWLEYLSRGAQDTMLAPAISTGAQFISGAATLITDRAWSQEAEKALPLKFLRNMFSAERIRKEGYKDRDYDTIMDANEFTEGQLFAMNLGFRPQAMADIQEANYFIAKNEKMIYNKRNELIDSWVVSAKKNDFDALVRTNKKIDEFNQMFPYHEKLLVMPNKLIEALDASLEKSLGKERGRQVLAKPEFDWIEPFRDSAKLKIIENRR